MTINWLVVAALASSTACKDKPQDKPAPPPNAQKGIASGGAKPTLPPSQEPPEPVTIEEATKVLPRLDGIPILGLKQTTDSRQVHGTWCIDGASAVDVAKTVGRSMAQAGFENLQIRGDERKAGVTGDRLGLRLSMVISASAAAICKAPAHYFASATIFRP